MVFYAQSTITLYSYIRAMNKENERGELGWGVGWVLEKERERRW